MKALVVFHDHGCHWASRFLSQGFKHVFVVVQDGDYWVSVDPRAGVPVVEVVGGPEHDMVGFYRRQDFTVVETAQSDQQPIWPFALANCVGAVKAVLGLRCWAVTPHQLYRRLTC